MAKVTGSYESVVRGVSEQVPQDRRSGQHYEQVNMISDPVRGLARRHGSKLLDEVSLGATGVLADLLADTLYHKPTTFFVEGVKYDLIYRTTAAIGSRTTFAWAFNKDTGAFLPIVYSTADPVLDTLVSGGVSAATNVGRYVYLAGNTVVPAFTATDTLETEVNRSKVVIWLRGGAYSRTFKVTLTKVGGVKVVASYKTVSSSYPNLLDTSDLLTSDPDYQKKVNDRVYAYNSEVTKWIGTAAEDITPQSIATKIAADLVTKGIAGVAVIDGTVTINDPTVADATGEDGGDGSLIRVVGNELTSPELVSTIHYAGKVVKIRPQRSKGDDAFYLKAYAKDEGVTGFTEVSWREAPGYVMQPTAVFAMGTVVAGVMYIAGTPAKLEEISGIDTPDFVANAVGDSITSALPYFFGKRIDYLGVFQDRLMVGAGATLMMSRPGDYLNWFRQSVLTVIDSDPWEGYALGAEDDTIKYSTTYDRNLLLYGDRFQYLVSGRQPLAPKTASIVVASSYEDATDAAPVASGNYVFYGKYAGEPGEQKASLHQVQAGMVADSPESFAVSQQLDSYIQGKPVQIVATTTPNLVFLRTDAFRNRLYTYGYLDNANGSERLNDSWSHWEWHTKVGYVVGVTSHEGGVLVYMVRENAGTAYIACERFTRDTGQSSLPYADSLRPLPDLATTPFLAGVTAPIVALQRDATANPLMGQPIALLTTFQEAYPTDLARAWVGFPFPAYTTPTNPYIRDREDRAILNGRLTLGRVIVTVADTGGLLIEVDAGSGTKTPLDFSGRVLGAPTTLIGQQPIVSRSLSAVVGKEVRECRYTLRAKTWLPLTITAIEWSGQVFNNSRRV
jgi:hypothetical protein